MRRPINVKVNADQVIGTQEHLWRWIGYDE